MTVDALVAAYDARQAQRWVERKMLPHIGVGDLEIWRFHEKQKSMIMLRRGVYDFIKLINATAEEKIMAYDDLFGLLVAASQVGGAR